MPIAYTANATSTGGRDGHGRTDDGKLDVKLSLPKEMGGDGKGTTPNSSSPSATLAATSAPSASSLARKRLSSRRMPPSRPTWA